MRYAEEDLLAAEAALEQDGLVPRHACWLAQQSTEKAIKAVLIFLQVELSSGATTSTRCEISCLLVGTSRKIIPI